MAERRRYDQDGVVVSLGELRDLIDADVEPQYGRTVVARVEPPRPVPLAVPAEVVAGVPSAAEVARQREARWQEDQETPVVAPYRSRRWRRWAVTAFAVLAASAATCWLTLWTRPSVRLAPGWQTAAALGAQSATAEVALAEAARQHRASDEARGTAEEALRVAEATVASLMEKL